jgi:hypothetical protein
MFSSSRGLALAVAASGRAYRLMLPFSYLVRAERSKRLLSAKTVTPLGSNQLNELIL